MLVKYDYLMEMIFLVNMQEKHVGVILNLKQENGYIKVIDLLSKIGFKNTMVYLSLIHI